MKPNELRIGNKVNYKDENHEFEVIEIDTLGMRVKDNEQETWIEYECFEAIPLTKERLIKFGFYKDKFELKLKINDLLFFYSKSFENVMMTSNNDLGGYNHIRGVKYVHQLQNLYFALTGKELTIN